MDSEKQRFLRYRRQILIPQIGLEGQEKLHEAKVLVVGAGGLGSPAAYYLAAAGIGTLGIMDNDKVDISNLNRQIVHWEKDLGRAKVDSAEEKLGQFNPEMTLRAYELELKADEALEIFPDYDIIISAVDNFRTRLVINKACYELSKPWVDGGVKGFNGIVTAYQPPKGPCYHCLLGNAEDEIQVVSPIIGTLPGIIGTLQTQEAIKLILGIGTPLTGRMLIFDGLESTFNTVHLVKYPDCPVCGTTDGK